MESGEQPPTPSWMHIASALNKCHALHPSLDEATLEKFKATIIDVVYADPESKLRSRMRF